MRLLIMMLSLWALAYARPEMYKEKEDFQFSRSSSDDGTKSGYYGAQRGNMGGNYEKAHNMDSYAQHQMSTLVRHVDGELGEGANTRTGSVFTSGNSRGIYGSGNYDLSNLKGRNFEEGASYGDSQSRSFSSQSTRHSSSLYSAADNERYNANQFRTSGLNSAYLTSGLASQYEQTDNQQALNQYSSARNYEHGRQGATNYKYYSHGGNQIRNEYDQSNANVYSLSNYDTSGSKLTATPVRFYIRPGTRVTVPVTAQIYDNSQSALVQDQNAVNTETELLSNSGQRVNVIVKPVSNAKHYENSYSYRKEWEKHDTQPITLIPTENPFPKNSELYEDSQLSQANEQLYGSQVDSANVQSSSNIHSAHASKVSTGYTNEYAANTKAAATNRLQYQSRLQGSGANAASNVYEIDTQNSDATKNLNSLVENINSKPKSYHSSYSYHKSWERRGDPYVIKPAGGDLNGQTSQKLLASIADQNLYAGNHYGQAACDLQCHLRKRRSYDMEQLQPQVDGEQISQQPSNRENLEYLGQQSQNKWDELESLGQQTQNQWNDLENLGQETDNKWHNLESLNKHTQSENEDLSQQSQNQLDNLQELGQQTQNTWDNLESLNQHPQSVIEEIGQQTQNQFDNLQELGQQTQNTWDNLESLNQHPQSVIEEIGQQTQNQFDNIEDLGQQTQSTWNNLENLDQHPQSNIEELSQKTENEPKNLEDLSQQTQNMWHNLESLYQHHQSDLEESNQQTQNEQKHIENLGQQTQNTWNDLENFNQHPQSGLEEIGQESQSQQNNIEDLGQQIQNTWNNLENLDQHAQNGMNELDQHNQNQLNNLEDLGQQTQNMWHNLETLDQHPQSNLGELSQKTQDEQNNIDNLGQQIQHTWNNLENLNQNLQSNKEELEQHNQIQSNMEDLGQQTENKLNNFDDSDQQTQTKWDSEKFTPQTQNELNDQQTLNTWNKVENQQSRKLEETGSTNFEHLHHHYQNSDHSFDQKQFFNNMQHGHFWDKIYNFELQQNMEPYNVNTYNQQRNFYNNLMSAGHNNDWKEFSDYFNQENFDNFYKDNMNQGNADRKILADNMEKSLWDAVDAILKESDKKTDNINNNQYFHKYHNWEENQHGSSYHHNSHNFYQNNYFGPTKDIETQSTESSMGTVFESIDQTSTSSTTEKNRISENPKDNLPVDIGRGDIGPEDLEIPTSVETNGHSNGKKVEEAPKVLNSNSNKFYKTQDEIESLSLTQLEDQYDTKYNQGHAIKLEHSIESTSTSTKKPRINDYHIPTDFTINKQREPTSDNTQISQVQVLDNFEQQNFEEQNLEQQINNMQDLTDFGQQVQVPVSENMQQEHYSPQEISNFEKDLQSEQKQVLYNNKDNLNELEKIQNINSLQPDLKNQETVEKPIETTEKPGFWGSVWKKTVNAKDAVVSWFKN